jgi:hypothetical protein
MPTRTHAPTTAAATARRRRGCDLGRGGTGSGRSRATCTAATGTGRPLRLSRPTDSRRKRRRLWTSTRTTSVVSVWLDRAAAHNGAASITGVPNQSSSSSVTSPALIHDPQVRRVFWLELLDCFMHRERAGQRVRTTLGEDHHSCRHRGRLTSTPLWAAVVRRAVKNRHRKGSAASSPRLV